MWEKASDQNQTPCSNPKKHLGFGSAYDRNFGSGRGVALFPKALKVPSVLVTPIPSIRPIHTLRFLFSLVELLARNVVVLIVLVVGVLSENIGRLV